MPSLAVSESWTRRDGCVPLDVWFDTLGDAPCALLYGEGRFRVRAEEPLAVFQDLDLPALAWTRQGWIPPILPDLIGTWSYELGHGLEPLAGPAHRARLPIPDVYLTLYRRVWIVDRQEGCTYACERTGVAAPLDRPSLRQRGPFVAHPAWDTDDAAAYAAKVEAIREEIARGNVYQVNLTRQEGWGYTGDLVTFARRLEAQNPAPFSALLLAPEFAVVSSSPERLLRVQDGWAETRPIKGTAPRDKDPIKDAALAEALLGSVKNRSELAMIVDLLRNDLARICALPTVSVDAFPEQEHYTNVHHLVATVRGQLREGLTLRDIAGAIFPGGSVTGCPKLAAMQVIRRLEERPRQVYTGALGWMRHDYRQMDWALPIRTAMADSQELVIGLGGGVVWDSDPADEYLETIHKGRSLVACLR